MGISGENRDGATAILTKRDYSRFPDGTKVVTLRTKDGAETEATLTGESVIGIAVELNSEFTIARRDVIDVAEGNQTHGAIVRCVETRNGKPFVRLDWIVEFRRL